MSSRSALYDAVLEHERYAPAHNAFRYRIYQLLLDLDELDELSGEIPFLSSERRNLVEDSAHRATLAMLRSRLAEWFARFVDPEKDGARKRVTGCGQLGLTPADGDGSDVFPADPIAPLVVPTAGR